ncbi:M48 family metalloprotease [Achromobacter sp. F4_2707]|uniref:M48 family metalloprotease n=1 Tax=Achromobacter sp. F4_2707 TaxID=3114286 RepID=UPI0039C74810
MKSLPIKRCFRFFSLARFHRLAVSGAISAVLIGWAVAPAAAQPMGIPSMGLASASELAPEVERTLGDAIMEQGRRDPTYIGDPDVLQYLTDMGRKLASHADTTAERINVFALRDPQINAFALPGGYIGINSGLVVAARSESELASVVAHEIAHVLQRHIARGMTQRAQTNHAMMAALAGALLAALSGSPDLVMGVAAFGQAAAVDRQLGFSRQAEQEADRVGLTMMTRAGYDPAGMARMFELLSNASRLNQGTGGNAYTSTHPLSVQRMSDAQNRTLRAERRPDISSDAFWYVRAKLRIEQARAGQALRSAEDQLRADARQAQGVQRSAAWYGLAYSAWKRRDLDQATEALEQARAQGQSSAQISGLEVAIALARGDTEAAVSLGRQAAARWPGSQGVALAQVEALQGAGRYEEAIDVLKARIQQWPEVPRLWQLLAQSQERLGLRAEARQSMAHFYELTGALPAAVEQLQQARAMTRDFYEQSALDVRIRELKNRLTTERALLERFKS